jgi:hypothetical protein
MAQGGIRLRCPVGTICHIKSRGIMKMVTFIEGIIGKITFNREVIKDIPESDMTRSQAILLFLGTSLLYSMFTSIGISLRWSLGLFVTTSIFMLVPTLVFLLLLNLLLVPRSYEECFRIMSCASVLNIFSGLIVSFMIILGLLDRFYTSLLSLGFHSIIFPIIFLWGLVPFFYGYFVIYGYI